MLSYIAYLTHGPQNKGVVNKTTCGYLLDF